MNIQEAYNKGLTVAEDDAYEKLTKALDGIDAGPFSNPKMEELRQSLFNRPTSNIIEGFFLEKPIPEELDSRQMKILEFLKYCKSLAGRKSRIGIKIKDMLRDIKKVDLS